MRCPREKPRRRDEGVALLLVLLFITLLTAIIVEYCYEMRVEAAFAGNHLEQFKARLAAESAVAAGMALLQQDLNNLDGASGGTFDALTDAWANGIPYQEINEAVMRCSIDDECGKINLNALVQGPEGKPNQTLENALRALFQARGLEQDPVDAILDWIDQDNEPRTNGAESDYYTGLQIPFGCKNAPLDSVEELLLIKGITPEAFFGNRELQQLPLTELLTVHGDKNGRVNVNTAERETLDAIGEALGRSGIADTILQSRQQIPFQSQEDLQTRGIAGNQDPNAPSTSVFSVTSNKFRIRGDGMARESKVRIEAFVSRNAQGGPSAYQIDDWRTVQ